MHDVEQKVSAQKRVCIIDGTSIAGTGRIEGINDIVSNIERGDRLQLIRDKDNYLDEWAIKIADNLGNRLGFISCDRNEILSRMMDAGFELEAIFDDSIERDGWTDVRIKVLLYA